MMCLKRAMLVRMSIASFLTHVDYLPVIFLFDTNNARLASYVVYSTIANETCLRVTLI